MSITPARNSQQKLATTSLHEQPTHPELAAQQLALNVLFGKLPRNDSFDPHVDGRQILRHLLGVDAPQGGKLKGHHQQAIDEQAPGAALQPSR